MTDLMIRYLATIKDITGDFGEFGVYKGNTLFTLLNIANKQGKRYIGVDSFAGMAEPTKHDYGSNGENFYPKGKLNSCQVYNTIMTKLENEYKPGEAKIYKGFVPGILEELDNNQMFSFCYIDLDHYQPTVDILSYLFPNKISDGGLVLFDDYLPKDNHNNNILATRAIVEFLELNKDKYDIEEDRVLLTPGGCNSQLLIRKK